jgi:hypothetical protein
MTATGTEKLAKLVAAHERLLAEAEHLRAQNSDMAALLREQGCRMLGLKDRVAELEAEVALLRGTLARPEPDDDQPEIIHDVPPNAPR